MKRCWLQESEPGTSTPIEYGYKIAIYPRNESLRYLVHVSTFFIPI